MSGPRTRTQIPVSSRDQGLKTTTL